MIKWPWKLCIEGGAMPKLFCDGKSSIRRTAISIAFDGEQLLLSDASTIEASVFTASAFDS